jgi:DNA modification methylase
MNIGDFELDKIYLGDAYELIKKIPDKSIDLIVTDPPYDFISKHYGNNYTGAGAFGKLGRAYHSELENSNIITGLNAEILKQLIRVMKKVNIYIWCNKEQILEYLEFFKDYNMDLLTWHKTNPVPTCCNKYLSDTEYILFFREKGVKINGTYETKKKYYVSGTNKEDKKLYGHPTIKPLEIIKNLIINSSKENDVVLDAFMGSGTTAVACKELNRHFIGFELNPEIYSNSIKRLNEKDLFSFQGEENGN